MYISMDISMDTLWISRWTSPWTSPWTPYGYLDGHLHGHPHGDAHQIEGKQARRFMYMNRTQHLQRPSVLEQQPECRRPMTGNAPRKSRKAGVASDVIGYPITSLATPVPISWFLCGVLHGVISFMPRPFRRCVWRGSRPRPLQSSVDSARAGLDTRGLGNEKAPRKNRGACFAAC